MGFQWLLARRYFGLTIKRQLRLIVRWPLVFGLIWAIIAVGEAFLFRSHNLRVQDFVAQYRPALLLARLIALIVWQVVNFFVVLIWQLSVFTTISIFGLFLGTAALVIVLSVMSGFEQDLKHKILGTNAHIVVTRPDQPFSDYERLRAAMAKLPDVVGATPFILNEVMLTSYSNESGVVVKGIDTATVGQVTDVAKNTNLGDLGYLDHPEKLRGLGGPSLFHDDEEPAKLAPPSAKPALPSAKPAVPDVKPTAPSAKPSLPSLEALGAEPRRLVPGVLVGRELAKSLRVYLGDDVNLISPFGGIGPSGPIPKSKPFRVAGLFFSGMFEYDNKYTYISLAAAQKFFTMEGEVSGIELKVRDSDRTEATVASLKQLVGPSYDVQDWKELNRSLFSALKIEKILMFVLLCFIILVAAFSIIANGTMLVMEKGAEVAILKSMGASDRSILGAFVLLGFFIGAVGTVTGIATGIFGCWALGRWGLPLDPDVYYITSLPVRMNPYEIAVVFVASLAIVMLATLYPAWLAARVRPVDGLRDAQR